MTRVRYRRGNPLHALAAKGFMRASLEARGLRRGLVQSILAGVPDGDGEHKKYPLRRVFTHFLLAVLDEDVGSLERAYEVLERRYLERIGEPTPWKQNPDGDTVASRLKELMPWQEHRTWVRAMLRGCVAFIRDQTRILEGGFDVAFDGTKRPAYPRKRGRRRRHKVLDLPRENRGEFERDDWRRDLVGYNGFKGTSQALAYATLQALGEHRLTLACEAMADCGNRFSEALKACLQEMAEGLGLHARCLFIDREASNQSVLRVVANAKQKGWISSYVIAARADARVLAALDAEPLLNVPYHALTRFRVACDVDAGGGIRMNLVEVQRLVETRGKPRPNQPDLKRVSFRFWTNLPVTEANVWRISQSYRRRWGIETGYREEKHSFRSVKFESRKLRRLAYHLNLVCLNLRAALNDPGFRLQPPEIPTGRAASLQRSRDLLRAALLECLDT